jgi:phage tail-like protein
MTTPITGSSDTKTGKPGHAYSNFKYYVVVEGFIAWAGFCECSGLSMATDVFEYQEGGLSEYVHKFPGRTKVSNVILKRGVTDEIDMGHWFKQMETKLRTGEKFDFRQVTITLLSGVNRNQVTWTLNRAFPVKWVGPAFKSDTNEVVIESLELAHHGITREEQAKKVPERAV